MRICVSGNIHAHTPALRAVLAATAPPEPHLNCRTEDAVPGRGNPAAALNTVLAFGCPWVTGNAEQWLVGNMEYSADSSSPRG